MNEIVEKVRDTLIAASSTFSEEKKQAYFEAAARETNAHAKWVLESIIENAVVAEKNRSPLCDDTGIPHLFLEVGKKRNVSGEMLESIYAGIELGLRELPGRPMAIKGNDMQRIDQSSPIVDENGRRECREAAYPHAWRWSGDPWKNVSRLPQAQCRCGEG